MIINREDMLELTRRMTVKRSCFTRVAGAYMDADGFPDGTFNIHFMKLSAAEQEKNLKIARAVPFADTNRQLKAYAFPGNAGMSAQIQRLLLGLNDCGLKNDALLDTLYEMIGERCRAEAEYAVIVFHGSYDVPLKASASTVVREDGATKSGLSGVKAFP